MQNHFVPIDLRLTSMQSKYRAYLLNQTKLQNTHHPIGFNSWEDGLHGNVEAFMEYFESGHCAIDHDAVLAAIEHQCDEHFRINATQYQNQIARIPASKAMQERYVSEEESSATEKLRMDEQPQAIDIDIEPEEISPELLS